MKEMSSIFKQEHLKLNVLGFKLRKLKSIWFSFFSNTVNFAIYLFTYSFILCVCVSGMCTCYGMLVVVRRGLWKISISFHHLSSGNWTQFFYNGSSSVFTHWNISPAINSYFRKCYHGVKNVGSRSYVSGNKMSCCLWPYMMDIYISCNNPSR